MSDSSFVEELRDSAMPFVRNTADLIALRGRRGTLPGHDEGAFATIAELGWLGVLVPEADGGLGLGLAEMAVVVGELEKGLLAEPLLGLLPGILALVHASPGDDRTALLGGVIGAETLPALALDRDGSVAGLSVVDGRLTGRCGSVASAHAATGFAVPVRDGAAIALYWVAADAAGLSLDVDWRADQSPLGVLTFEQTPGTLLAADFGTALESVLDEARILASAASVGLLRHVLEITLEYMRTRVQYEKPIGSFQALQHLAVDLHIQQELAIAVLESGIAAYSRPQTDRERAIWAARVKGRCSDAMLRIIRGAIQIHGAIGITDEFDLGLYVKRGLVLSAWLGNASQQRARFADLAIAEA